MASIFPFLINTIIGFTIVGMGIEIFGRMIRIESKLLFSYESEVLARHCAEIGALGRNLASAAEILKVKYPFAKLDVERTLKAFLDHLGGKGKTCEISGSGFFLVPYEQANPNLDRKWPNWFVRMAKNH